MGLLMFIYTICALRINVIFVLKFLSLIFFFTLLAGSWWQLALENEVIALRLQVVSSRYSRLIEILLTIVQGSGACLFVATMLGFYLLAAQLFASVGLPFNLPVGDLSGLWDRKGR